MTANINPVYLVLEDDHNGNAIICERYNEDLQHFLVVTGFTNTYPDTPDDWGSVVAFTNISDAVRYRDAQTPAFMCVNWTYDDFASTLKEFGVTTPTHSQVIELIHRCHYMESWKTTATNHGRALIQDYTCAFAHEINND